MRVRIDGYAWVEKASFTAAQLQAVREHLTIHTGGDTKLTLFVEIAQWIGLPREYYLPKRKSSHHVEDCTVRPSYESLGLPPVRSTSAMELYEEQEKARDLTQAYFNYGPRGGLLIARPGWGKCCAGSTTYVDGETGCRTTIAESVGLRALVPSLQADGSVGHSRASKIWQSGIKACLKLTLASGQWFEGSADHPVLTPTGYVPLDQLKPDDLVAVARTVPAPKTALPISDDEVLLAAAMMMDGSNTQATPEYVKGNAAMAACVRAAAERADWLEGVGHETYEQGAYYVPLLKSKRWLERWGLALNSKFRRVPAAFFGLNDTQLALFLRWVFSDGNVYVGTPRKIELCLASEGLIDDVQYLLRRFGICARKSYKKKAIKQSDGTKQWYDAWRLQIADLPTLRLFLERIGDVVGSEAACAQMRADIRSLRSNTNWDVVPVGRKELTEIRAEEGGSHWIGIGGVGATSCIGRERFERLCAETGYTGKYKRFADMDVVWERVRTLVPTGEQPVYDITVPGTENVVANGLVVHNTVYACSVIEALQTPTLVVVTKEFFIDQWRRRLEAFLPGIRIGVVQGERCEYQGYHVSIGLVQSLSQRRYEPAFYKAFGLLLPDEVHYMGAQEWSPVPGLFHARWRLGLTGTPRRTDGAERAFEYHIGQVIYEAKEQSLPFKTRFVFSDFYTSHVSSGGSGEKVVTDYLVSDVTRNKLIAFQLLEAVKTGRKVLVLSSRRAHLKAMDEAFRARCAQANTMVPSIGYYVGGRNEAQLEAASECRVIFATSDQAAVGLDIPALDTLFLTTPMTDVEQAVGRIQRPCQGKKQPVVVDFRDDRVPSCRETAIARLRFYKRNDAA